ncbi:MAG TPA: archaetidylserine decarboxylase [Polyangiaceae bacterium]|jgi:phosphatidylserine decarboxylase
MGKLADHRWSLPVERAVVKIYSRVYDIDFDECVQRNGYASFDEFFTRELRPGVRPIDPAREAIVSPADGQIDSMGPIDPDASFFVKGRPYRVAELLGDEEEAKRYVGGVGSVIYLSPRDYHRVHAPVDGTIGEIRSLAGDYYPVNSIGMSHVGNLFAINRRVVIPIDTQALGRVTVVMVAAIVVGRITVPTSFFGIDAHDVPNGHHRIDPVRVARGDEIGVFHLGSTAVVFIEPCAKARWDASAGAVRFGQRIATATATKVLQ